MYSNRIRLPALGALGRISEAGILRISFQAEASAAPTEHTSAAAKDSRASTGSKTNSRSAKR